MERCPWAGSTEGYQRYHDEEWGVPTHDDRRALRVPRPRERAGGPVVGDHPAQARGVPAGVRGLRSRRGGPLRRRRHGTPPGRRRHRAQPPQDRRRDRQRAGVPSVQREFGSFDAFVWPFVGGTPIRNAWTDPQGDAGAHPGGGGALQGAQASRLPFVGPTVVYAYMQACGLVNDHLVTCFRYAQG